MLIAFKKYEAYKEEIAEELISFYLDFSKEENIGKIKKKIKILEAKKDKLLDLALDNVLSKEELYEKKLSIEKELSRLKVKLEIKKVRKKEEETYKKELKENILKELKITKDNLEVYIEELLDKIIVERLEGESKLKLKITLAGDNVIKYEIPVKNKQVSQIKKNKVTDVKN